MTDSWPDQFTNPQDAPSALVLTGGGARAAYQVGVLSAIAERAGDMSFPIVTGVSAGALNAAYLAGYRGSLKRAVAHLERNWLRLSINQVFRTGFHSLCWSCLKWLWLLVTEGTAPGFQVRGVLDTEPLRRSLSGAVSTKGIEANLAKGRLRAVALSATSYATGQTVTFVHDQGDSPMWKRAGRISVRTRISVDHVLASCALPLFFPAVSVGDAYFGDGSIRLSAPLAPAIHLGAGRVLAIAVRRGHALREDAESRIAEYPRPAQIVGMLFNAVFMDALDHDSERLERTNRYLALLPRGVPHPEGLRPIQLLVLRPSRDLGELSRDLIRYLPRAVRLLVRGMGAARLRSPDLLSYLLFEKPYVERLIELGRDDAFSNWDRIAPMLEPERAGNRR